MKDCMRDHPDSPTLPSKFEASLNKGRIQIAFAAG